MRVYFETNKGLMRENNEDNLIVEETDRYNLYAVADGMGGHKAGEVASSIAIDTIKSCFMKSFESEDFKAPTFIIESINKANDKIRKESLNKEEYEGMGTTITMAVVDHSIKTAYIGNVGDSRAYIIKNDEIRQITEDHTYVHELLKDGRITTEEAKTHPKRNVITRAVGSEDFVHADIFEIEVENDIILLCTDGLTIHLSDDKIKETIKEYGSSESVQRLIKLANDNGGTDNITIIIVDNTIRGEAYDR
ncbi:MULTISPECIES: Stp1/IreP family PP2C-type Ser/Thr phosphatase [Sedimentibacter]|uniref:Stp1/IreP family PP2C-type Ser/Thr phosphatase n=1 Tax=Sedimentibacter hydroxybenzoicus DSM 7310 TaxID=1123245 RepID=A0A974GWH3_SEDHY|nr:MULTISPECIES: Stp1/IreP family PP2C-type Ser/Thr phosphatase [Sedimentibacter]NYB74453.1 Stp1/IreP family PP2C-type Ser/Thr phosphatase [Sedimentibacter hydroxybenzoicus DSM 7310]